MTTAIWKGPVVGRVAVRGVNLVGDEQADRESHGGPDKAVYAYAVEDYGWWSEELGDDIGPGTFGENLTLAGVDVTGAIVGERWDIGSSVFEVCQPRTPCGKLGVRMGDPRFPRRFAAAGRPGAYLRIHAEGDVGPGDEVRITHRPAHGLTVGGVELAFSGDRALLPRLLLAPELAVSRLTWAMERAARELRRAPDDHALREAMRWRLHDAGLGDDEVDEALRAMAEG